MSSKNILILTIFSFVYSNLYSQSGFQPWKAPFKRVEIVSQSETHLSYLKNGKPKSIALKKIEYFQKEGSKTYPNDFVLYLTGKQKILSFESTSDSMNLVFKKKNNSLKTVARNHIFSYHKSGVENVMFRAYITPTDSMSIDAARAFSEGGRDARRFYKKPYGAIANFAVGALGGYFLGPYGIIPAGIYTGIEAAVPPYTKGKRLNELTQGRIQHDPYYQQGFLSQVRKRRAFYSAMGGVAGFVVGWGTIEYIKSQE